MANRARTIEVQVSQERLDKLRVIWMAVLAEREFQDRKWGDIQSNPHTVLEWICIMEKELQEAKLSFFQKEPSATGDMLREILQVVAVGLACIEQHGVIERN